MRYENYVVVTEPFKKGDRIYKEIVSIIKDDLRIHNLPKKNLKIWIKPSLESYFTNAYVYYEVNDERI